MRRMLHKAIFYQKFIEKNFSVVDMNDKTVPFIWNPIQKRIAGDLTGMDIILKARRHGMSTLILAMMAVDFIMTENFRAVVVSHETKATQKLLDKVNFFLESMKASLPPEVIYPVKMKYASRNELVNENKNSSFYIGTAGAKAFGRGDQISWLHLSEAASYDDLNGFLVGIVPAVQGGNISIETTAKGYNYFRDLWVRNQDSPKPYKTHFIPWFENPEYIRPCSLNETFTEEEKALMQKYSLNGNQISWRRYELDRMNGDLDHFGQEYPASAEEAFIVSGNCVWSPSLIRWYMDRTKKPVTQVNLFGVDPVRVEENEKGYVKIWKAPDRRHRYVIGADVAEGKNQGDEKQGDYSCAQVLNQNTMEQVAVWRGRLDPDLYGRQLDMLGRYYNNALIAVEKNSIGLLTLNTLRDLYYPNLYYREKFGLISEKTTEELGWVTDRMTKDLIVSVATQQLRDKRIRLYDEDTLGEMKAFVRNSAGQAGAASGYHDDLVMSLLIAIKMLSQPQNMEHGNPIERDAYSGIQGIFTSNIGESGDYVEDFGGSEEAEISKQDWNWRN